VSEAEFTAPAPAGALPVEYASFARRLGAALLDSLVWIVGISFVPLGEVSDTAAGIIGLVILSLWFNYFAICEWRWGQTIGKNMTGIRVLPLESGRLSWQAAALRNILRLVDLPLALVGVDYLIVRGSPRRQRLGDRAAKTIVVREGERPEAAPAVPGSAPASPGTVDPGPVPAAPYGGAPAAEIFGEAAEALAMHPSAGSVPAPSAPATTAPAPAPAEAAAPGGAESSWTAAGFPYATWDLRRTVLGLLGGLLVALFAPILVVPFDPDLDSTGGLLVAQALFGVALISVAIGVASDPGGVDVRESLSRLGLRRFPASALGWAALGYVAYFVFVAIYATVITSPDQEDIARELGLDTGPLAAVAVVAVIAIIAPISEELFFRGMLFGGLRKRLETVPAAVISAVVFGALHAPTGITAVPPLIVLGIVFALVYERTGSLGPAIVLHMANNSLALAVTA
jgi:membrane protease YdiL (CAAX protease family)/uncharacterized RDD family membrane protein YckC